MEPMHSLYLVPAESTAAPAPARVVETLRRLEVIGAPLGQGIFSAGPGFARHVVFAGCSPHLIMTAPADGSQAFCHVAIHGPFEHRQLVTGTQAVRPRCPHCRQRLTDWQQQIDRGIPDKPMQCSSCYREFHPCEADWRQHAVCGRLLIELRNVFPGEAVPSDTLMRELTGATQSDWGYGWAAYFEPVGAPK